VVEDKPFARNIQRFWSWNIGKWRKLKEDETFICLLLLLFLQRNENCHFKYSFSVTCDTKINYSSKTSYVNIKPTHNQNIRLKSSYWLVIEFIGLFFIVFYLNKFWISHIRTVKYAYSLVLLAKEETVLWGMFDRLIEIKRCYGMEKNVESVK